MPAGSRRSADRSGCKACMDVNWQGDIKHHELVSLANRNLMRVNRFFPDAAKNLNLKFDLHNISVSKVVALFLEQTFDKRKRFNHKWDVNNKTSMRGDSHGVLDYFKMKQVDNTMFYYDIQFDDEDRVEIDTYLKINFPQSQILVDTTNEKEKSCVNLISKERRRLSAEYDLKKKYSSGDRKLSEKRRERSFLKRRPGVLGCLNKNGGYEFRENGEIMWGSKVYGSGPISPNLSLNLRRTRPAYSTVMLKIQYSTSCISEHQTECSVPVRPVRQSTSVTGVAATVQEIAKSISSDVVEKLEMAKLELKYCLMAMTDPEQLDAEYYKHTFAGAKKYLEKRNQEFGALTAKFNVQSARMKEFEDQSARVKELEAELKLGKENIVEEAKTTVKLAEKHSGQVEHDDVMSKLVEALKVE
ncbi:hypothetical protein GIB67_042781 [Kingdonia uniflora]|uniref:Uncharacterized protein n=1 Tax=Kingdonia uniflora TaxID=39325 RepID=A0A7J7L0Z5_9MAGN|nr:hypothetical protein GIB67_042781 [Kingdonia uniflora]